jgi:hypothetical protein
VSAINLKKNNTVLKTLPVPEEVLEIRSKTGLKRSFSFKKIKDYFIKAG